jgi:phosphonate transport system permease protein
MRGTADMTAPSTPLAVAPLQLDVPKSSLLGMLAWGGVMAVLAASWQGADMRPLDLVRDSGNMARYAAIFFRPTSASGAFTCRKCW